MGLFDQRTRSHGKNGVPVWFMRQAGRYHQHYQNLKQNHDFMTLCKVPELACEVTHGPINDFGFDAAILFSDLLFPLEHLGMGLTYRNGPPELAMQLAHDTISKLSPVSDAEEFYDFQRKALLLLKESLPAGTTLLGFVGAPFTLYTYAVEGSHAGGLVKSKVGLYSGLWKGFLDHLLPSLKKEIELQVRGGSDAICLFDTAAGELAQTEYEQFLLPVLRDLTSWMKDQYPETRIVYYSKMTSMTYLEKIKDENIDVLGVDWRFNLTDVFNSNLAADYMIQGNIDPALLHLPQDDLKRQMDRLWNEVDKTGADKDQWIMGLGHGVLKTTPEENVRFAVNYVKENFCY